MIAGPTLFLAILFLAAAAAYFLRRLEAVSALLSRGRVCRAGGRTLAPAAGSPRQNRGRPVLLGQQVTIGELSLVITPASRALLVFLLITAAVTFILAWRTYQGRTFYPFGLVLVALGQPSRWCTRLTLAPLRWSWPPSVGVPDPGRQGRARRAAPGVSSCFPTLPCRFS